VALLRKIQKFDYYMDVVRVTYVKESLHTYRVAKMHRMP